MHQSGLLPFHQCSQHVAPLAVLVTFLHVTRNAIISIGQSFSIPYIQKRTHCNLHAIRSVLKISTSINQTELETLKTISSTDIKDIKKYKEKYGNEIYMLIISTLLTIYGTYMLVKQFQTQIILQSEIPTTSSDCKNCKIDWSINSQWYFFIIVNVAFDSHSFLLFLIDNFCKTVSWYDIIHDTIFMLFILNAFAHNDNCDYDYDLKKWVAIFMLLDNHTNTVLSFCRLTLWTANPSDTVQLMTYVIVIIVFIVCKCAIFINQILGPVLLTVRRLHKVAMNDEIYTFDFQLLMMMINGTIIGCCHVCWTYRLIMFAYRKFFERHRYDDDRS